VRPSPTSPKDRAQWGMRLALPFLLVLAACGGKGAAAPGSATATTPSSASSTSTAADPGSAPAADSSGSSAAPGGSATATDASPPPEAIASALPIDLGKKVPPFPVRSVLPPKLPTFARGAVPVPEGLASQVDPTLPFFAWEQVMPPGVVLTFLKNAGLDLYVALFDGEVSIKADDIEGRQKRLWRWNAARVPGLGAMIECKEPTRAIFVLVTNTPGATLGQAAAPGQKVSWTKRPAPVKSVELDKQPDLAWGGGAYHARLGFEDGSASLGSLMASKNAPVRQNVHDHEWEILAILSGDGTLARTVGGQEQATPIAAGTFASIAPGVLHAYRPAGTSPLVAMQLFLPPGPEQRFKKLAGAASP
jgi:mannose-6-phosphate isomerase-like protein (cupin superfamily)